MSWRVWSKLCCGQKWILLFFPIFLLFLMIFVVTITLPLPLPPTDSDRHSSRALSSTGQFRSKPRLVEPFSTAAFQQHPPRIHSSRTSPRKEPFKYSVPHRPSEDAAGDDKNSTKMSSHPNIHRNTHRSEGMAYKNKEVAGAIQSASHHHPQLSDFTVNNTEPKHRIKPSSHITVVKPTAQAHIYLERKNEKNERKKRKKSTRAYRPSPADSINRSPQAGRDKNMNANRQTNIIHSSAKLEHQQKLRQATKHSVIFPNVDNKLLSVKKPSRDRKKHNYFSENPPERRVYSGPPDYRRTVNRDDSAWCKSFKEQSFSDSDHRRIRMSKDLHPLPWFSKDDIQKMELLAGGEVVSKARVPAHGQVLQVAMNPPAHHQISEYHQSKAGRTATHSEHCQQGLCSLIKRSDDWFEVFAFHLDRVLGLNRSLPVVLRRFHSDILPNRYINGSPRPAVWWDPDIQHLADIDSDQNSVPLSWVQYQKMLLAGCGNRTELRSEPCVGVQHSEWGRLALFDFLLQVNDRLDRYCCGFRPDPAELCVENLLHNKCGNSKDLLLVHILVSPPVTLLQRTAVTITQVVLEMTCWKVFVEVG
ncbi:uncharacterized protein gask1a [Kryptolebias marmoratus]|uniref:Golgi associated kinase 1A n=1 Tax=Kryptolebias marmoratus TaxID=37003 RepID=A0A3Q2ZPB3_KRYMA|nr:uncharacterized protein gask1a [Kryptolebias marmoratus]